VFIEEAEATVYHQPPEALVVQRRQVSVLEADTAPPGFNYHISTVDGPRRKPRATDAW
jgi:hypothetical protein